MMRPDLSHSPRLISTPFRQSRVLPVWTLILFDPNTADHHEADERGDKPDHAKDTSNNVQSVMVGHLLVCTVDNSLLRR